VKRTWKTRGGVALAVVAVVVLWRPWSDGDDEDDKEPQIASATRGQIVAIVSTTGRVVPHFEVEIKCKASGEVVALPKDVSDPVEKGMLLVELDPRDEQRRVTQAEISLSASRARVEQQRKSLEVAERTLATDRTRAEATLASATARATDARAKADRTKALLDRRLASKEEYGTAHTAAVQAEAELESAHVRREELRTQELGLEVKRQDLKLAEAQVRSDEITLADAQQRLSETKVFAPIDGVLSSRTVEIGQIVSSGINNIGGGTTLMNVADLSRMFVLAAVDESDIGRVEVGQTAAITTDAYPAVTFEGEVRRIATRGINTSNVVTFEVKIEVTDERRGLLKPEMTASIEVEIARSSDAVLVPAGAVVRGRRGFSVVLAEADGEETRRPVEIGVRNDDMIEITTGLKEGEQVVLGAGGRQSRWRNERDRPRGPRLFGRSRSKK
jgi:HlyD family secretion protein